MTVVCLLFYFIKILSPSQLFSKRHLNTDVECIFFVEFYKLKFGEFAYSIYTWITL